MHPQPLKWPFLPFFDRRWASEGVVRVRRAAGASSLCTILDRLPERRSRVVISALETHRPARVHGHAWAAALVALYSCWHTLPAAALVKRHVRSLAGLDVGSRHGSVWRHGHGEPDQACEM